MSVLCATYNYGRYLPDAVESVLTQTYAPVELIVIDDGSTDDTAEILARYADRIVSRSVANAGQNAAFNAAFELSTGELICLLDADDIMHPGKIATVVATYQQNPDAEWVFHDLRYIDRASRAEVGTPVTALGALPPRGRYDQRSVMRAGLEPIIAPAASGLTFSRSLFARLGPLPELMDFGDHYLKFGAFGLAPGVVLSDRLTDQGIHGANAFTNRRDLAAFRSRRCVNVAHQLERLDPSLSPFCDRLTAQGIWNSRFGWKLPPAERRLLARMMWAMGWSRRRGLFRTLATRTARRGSARIARARRR